MMYKAKFGGVYITRKEKDERWRPLYKKEEWNLSNLQPKFSNCPPNLPKPNIISLKDLFDLEG